MNCLLGIILLIHLTNGANILGLQATDLNSHFQVFSSVIETLAPFHNITFYFDVSINYNPPSNVIVKKFHAPFTAINFNISEILKKPCEIDSFKIFCKYILSSNQTYYKKTLQSKLISQLINSRKTYDILLLSGYGAEYFLQLAEILNIPTIQITPSLLLPWHNTALRNSYSWIYDFSFMISETSETFSGRLIKIVKNTLVQYRYWTYLSALSDVSKSVFSRDMPSIPEVNRKTKLIFTNTHNVMGYKRPSMANVVEIGGLHIKPPKTLSEDLENFIAGAGEHGFIYFSLGTIVQESSMTENTKQSILHVLSKLKQRVLWKWNGQMKNVSENVRILKWLPQNDILAHKKIKLFITQGGMLSTQEAVYHGVPVLIMPVIFDQHHNAFLAEKKGFGKSLTFCDFSEKLFEKYVNELIFNVSYSQTLKQMSLIMKYQNKDLSEKVNWWVDFVINNKGSQIFQPLLQHNNWLDLPFDLYLFFTFIFSCLLCVCLCLFIHIFKAVFIVTSNLKSKNE